MQKLSHLAFITLGVVAEFEPCSGYAVMKSFQVSTSTYFSGSAGSIYPLLRRLEALGLIKAERSKAGTRVRRTYSVTEKGRRRLHAWLAEPVPDDDVAFTVDLLRVRVLFFKTLSKIQRRTFVKDARAALHRRIKFMNDKIANPGEGSQYDVVCFKNVVMTDEARLRWLDAVEAEMC